MTGIETTYAMSLGGNLPFEAEKPNRTLGKALAALSAEGVVIRAVSRFFVTPAFPPGAGPDFVNAAALLRSSLPPADLLALLHRVEAAFGRERRERWATRTLDLDLLTADGLVLPDLQTWREWQELPESEQRIRAPDRLILPHPRLEERSFVLVPLCDIAPEWVHPVTRRTVRAMCAALKPEDIAGIRAI